jgi:protein-tyrosine phosphatase
MIDCHTHLLPNFDDGSTSLEGSIRILQQMAAGGIKAIFCTSHYMRGQYQFSAEDYQARFNALETEVKTRNIPIALYPGAEVFLTTGISEDIKEKKLTMADSSYVLIETELNGFPADMQKNLYDLIRNGYRPILAHAERYVSVMMKAHEAKELISKGVYIQVNAGSLLGGYGEKVKETAWKLVNRGWVHLLGSDDHNKGDYTSFFRARDKIVEHVDEHTADLLTNINPQAVLTNQKIPYDYVIVHREKKGGLITRLKRTLGL